ncbi:MAG: peptidoglycan DD-metalloendopeptidase family protein [Tissierellia bacterium]|nr:peptidoglycan DD-metalloendopeptidase family protein [Tissierellia bacterium]
MSTKDKSKDHNICVVIIPPTDKVRRLTVPVRFLKAAIAVGLVAILIFSSILISHGKLKAKYKAKVSEMDSLVEENKNLEEQIALVDEKSSEIQDKITELENLKRQLEKMAGINSSSRGTSLTDRNRSTSKESLRDVEALEKKLEAKEKEFKAFVEEIEERFEYLETVPDQWPAQGRLTSTFGSRRHPITRRTDFHWGIDIANSRGTSIYAAGKGKVVFSGYKSGYGRLIIIDHQNSYKSLYAHNSKLLVNVGDLVDKGQIIAKMGSTGRSTGTHLHFEIHYKGDPVDPLTILK